MTDGRIPIGRCVSLLLQSIGEGDRALRVENAVQAAMKVCGGHARHVGPSNYPEIWFNGG
jgi:hypothetical protein